MKFSVCLYTFLFLTSAGFPTGTTSAEPAVEEIHRRCGEQWGVPGAIASCLLEEERRYGIELERAYRELINEQGDAHAAVLRESQRAWLKYQENNCRFYELSRLKGPVSLGRRLLDAC